MITLYDFGRSSASYRVRLALHHLALPFRRVPVNLAEGEQKSSANLARNPQGLVPTLEVDGMMIPQSLAILEYLNDTHGGLLPEDSPGRARVRALCYAVAMEIAPICNSSVRGHVERLTAGTFRAIDWQRHYMTRGLGAIEAMLQAPQTGLFCHGDTLTMADLCLLPQIYNARAAGLDPARWPVSARIAARMEHIPALQAAHPEEVTP